MSGTLHLSLSAKLFGAKFGGIVGAGVLGLALLGASGCCMGGSAPVAPIAPIVPPPAVAPAIVAPPAVAAQAVTIGAGFVPDPNIVYTYAGGPIAGSSMSTGDTYCNGWLAAAPNITLTTTTPIAGLRILARAADDSTLAVRLSDGRVLCDDDGGGYPNPAITADFPAGVHQIYVGTFRMGETPLATVGITTNPAYQNTLLP